MLFFSITLLVGETNEDIYDKLDVLELNSLYLWLMSDCVPNGLFIFILHDYDFLSNATLLSLERILAFVEISTVKVVPMPSLLVT
jgi:hypothetical protein